MITDFSQRLIVQEGSPRDGLQIEPTWVETADKIDLIDQLSRRLQPHRSRLFCFAQSHCSTARWR